MKGPSNPSNGQQDTLSARATGLWWSRDTHRRLYQRGTAIDRYIVIEPRAVGGFGVVYTAYDPKLDRKVALKVSRVLGRAQRRVQTLTEAKIAARLCHPNVVTIYDAGVHEDRLYIAMELVDGPTLREWLKVECRPWASILSVLLQCGRGLEAVHASGLAHLDFKPDNVIVTKNRAVVLDFGLARQIGEPRLGLRQQRAYAAPELRTGGVVDPRIDQYAFCSVACEALFGRCRTCHRLRSRCAIRMGPAPMRLREPIHRGLSDDPERRFRGMRGLLERLEGDAHSDRGFGWIVLAGACVWLSSRTCWVWRKTRTPT